MTMEMDDEKFKQLAALFGDTQFQGAGAPISSQVTPPQMSSVYETMSPSPQSAPDYERATSSIPKEDNEAQNVDSGQNVQTPTKQPQDEESAPQSSQSNYMPSEGDLNQIAQQKRKNAVLGEIADSLSNQQGFGNFYLGKLNPKNSSENLVNAQNAALDAPMQAKMQLLDLQNRYQKAKEGELALGSAQAARNPNGQLAQTVQKVYGGMLSQAGLDPNIVKNMSPSDLEQFIKSPVETAMKLKGEMAYKQAMLGNKNDTVVDKMAGDMKKDLDPDVSRAGNFGTISQKIIQGERLKALATDSQGRLLNLPAAQQEELALGFANMASSGGAQAESRVRALVPHSIVGDAQKIKQWLMNEPEGTNQQAFTQFMMGRVDAEEKLAQKQMAQIRAQRLPSHSKLKQRDPELYNSILQGYGMNADGSSKNQSPNVSQSPDQSNEDQQAIQWAQANKQDPRAQKILQMHGAQ